MDLVPRYQGILPKEQPKGDGQMPWPQPEKAWVNWLSKLPRPLHENSQWAEHLKKDAEECDLLIFDQFKLP